MADPRYLHGITEVQRLFVAAGKAPARVISKSTRKGAAIVQRAAKTYAPKDEGVLRQGIVLKAERSQKGKKVYQVVVKSDPRFVKISKAGKRSFYPSSQEYGWTDPSGKYHPGFRYLRKAAERNKNLVLITIVREMGKELDKLR